MSPKRELLKLAKDDNCFIYRSLQPDKKLPWDFIDMGFPVDFLRSEYDKALKLSINP